MEPFNLANLPHGDMPGDKIEIGPDHIRKAEKIYPILKSMLAAPKTVVSVSGGSGVGKSEIASLLASMLQKDGIGAYVMSGDNYPHRIPSENDAERERVYAEGGQDALNDYLGSQDEIDFILVNRILADFKSGKNRIFMKRMGRLPGQIWFDEVDFSNISVLLLEWTHGNSDNISGVDVPIFLIATPAETLEHRRKRARDKGVDSPFVTLVLGLEQAKLHAQAHKAKIIVTKSGDIISFEEYLELLEAEND